MLKKKLLLTGKDYNIMKEFPQHFLFKWVQWAQPVIEDKEQEVWLLQYSLKCNHLMQFSSSFSQSLSVGVRKSVCFCILNHGADVAHAYFAVL